MIPLSNGMVHGVIYWDEPVHKTVSHLREVRDEIRSGANALAREAAFRLKPPLTGDAQIEVVHRRQANQFGPGSELDSYVMLTAHDEYNSERDEEYGWPAAMSIEFGAKNGGGGRGPLRAAVEALAKGVKQH